MMTKITSLILFLLIWLGLTGFNTDTLSLVFAVLVPSVVYLIASYLNILPKKNVFKFKAIFYIFWLLKEIFTSALNVIKIAWRPNLSIQPVLEPIRSKQVRDEAITLYANSITLTPGTVTLNIIDNNLLVHALDVSIMDDLKKGKMDQKIFKIIK